MYEVDYPLWTGGTNFFVLFFRSKSRTQPHFRRHFVGREIVSNPGPSLRVTTIV